jgi:hypothetical protein
MLDIFFTREAIEDSARLLGVLQGGTLAFDSEDEMSVFADFILHEYSLNGRKAVEIYREEIGGEDEVEEEILASLSSAYTSLFKVVAIMGDTAFLKDLLAEEEKFIELTDITFSKTATPGLLIFTRIVPFKDFNMTSGVSFLFWGHLLDLLIRKYRKMRRKIKTESTSMKRFISFFRLNRKYGEEIMYREV